MCKQNSDCACCDMPEPEPCSTYEQGRNGRCVYCDHEKACHKTWGDVFLRHRRRGDGIDRAAIAADMWEMRHKPRRMNHE